MDSRPLARAGETALSPERKESMSLSVLFIVLGFGLIILGVLSDSAHNLFYATSESLTSNSRRFRASQ